MKDLRSSSALLAPALLSLALLSACADSGPTPVMHCPDVDMLQQARTLTVFEPGRQDVAARVTTAQLTGISGTCKLEGDKHALLITVQAGFEADDGPANNGAALSLPWFVAITQGDNIISETDYTIKLAFDGNSTAAASSQAVKVEFPNLPETNGTQVLVGFKMTPDQLAYAAAHPTAAP